MNSLSDIEIAIDGLSKTLLNDIKRIFAINYNSLREDSSRRNKYENVITLVYTLRGKRFLFNKDLFYVALFIDNINGEWRVRHEVFCGVDSKNLDKIKPLLDKWGKQVSKKFNTKEDIIKIIPFGVGKLF